MLGNNKRIQKYSLTAGLIAVLFAFPLFANEPSPDYNVYAEYDNQVNKIPANKSPDKYSEKQSENIQKYNKASVSERTIYDITNYGAESDSPYKIENYKTSKTDILSTENLKAADKKSDNSFYIALQSNFFLPNSIKLNEPQYFGASLPTLPSDYSGALDALPNGTRSGLYANLSTDETVVYPQFSIGMRTNNNFRFELSYMQSSFKLENDKSSGEFNPSYTDGYNLSSRQIKMDFNQQLYMLNGYLDLKFNRVWLYFGAGIGVVNNELKDFTLSIENSIKTEQYTLTNIIDSKKVYKRSTMLTIGTYFKIFEGGFIDINMKKISGGKISTSKDYILTKKTSFNGLTDTSRVSLNFLESDINPYLISLGFRFEF